jgi:LysM repeat protein/outer membrane murein-binding lipoprotein Lpp
MALSKTQLIGAFILCTLFLPSCSPIKSTAKEEKHQIELTLHEVQTNLDDLRHDVHCFQTEIQILEGKIKHHENTISCLKQGYLEKQDAKIDELRKDISEFQKKFSHFDSMFHGESKDIKQLSSHANETTNALTQYKERIGELEKQLLVQNRKLDEIFKLKSTLEMLAQTLQKDSGQTPKIYKVKMGDSLEKIAKAHQTNVEYLKKINHLEQDLIVVGQELKLSP